MAIFFDRTEQYFVDVWQERDRYQATLYRGTPQGSYDDDILTLTDGEYVNAVEDGFINPNNLLATMVWYAKHLGLIE